MKPYPDNGAEAEREPRLDSWKAIAAYLNRDVRTAHRWEQQESLPVHRHLHGKRGTVYAYPAEIDAWLADRSTTGNGDDALNGGGIPIRWAAVAILLVAGAAAAWVLWPTEIRNATPVNLLVAASENRSGEVRLDGVIDSWLQNELGGAGVTLLPPSRIRETLALIRQPTDREPDRLLMLDIAARNPDANVIVTSSLDRFGDEFTLTVELVDPETGSVLETVRSEASDETGIPRALDQLITGTLDAVNRIDLPDRAVHPGFEPVTTASPRAAELYWEASRVMFEEIWNLSAAENLLRQAIDLDPGFATALIQLALAIHEQSKPASEWQPFADRAYELTQTVSPAERLFIAGSYNKLHGDLEAARIEFVTLNDSYPEHFWGQVQMAELSHARGNLEGAAWSMAVAADLRPQSIEFHYDAMHFILTTQHAWTADRIVERLFELNSPAGNGNVHPFMPAEFYEVNRLLLDGSGAEAFNALELLRQKLDRLPDNIWTKRSEYAARLAEVYLALGRLGDAETLLELIRRDDADIPRNTPLIRMRDRQRLTSLLAVSRGETCCDAGDFDTLIVADSIIMGIRAGRQSSGTLADALSLSDSPVSRILQGEVAYQNGDLNTAIELLSASLNEETERLHNLGLAPGPVRASRREFYLAADTLASALLDSGESGEAMRLLARWSDDRARTMAFMSDQPFAPYWIRLRSRLEALYRDTGRDEEAAAIRSYLSSLLATADDDHSIANRIRGE